MSILDFLLVVAYGYLCYRIGWSARELTAKKAVNEMFSELETLEKESDNVVRIYFEKDQGNIFAYNYETDEFIAQADSKQKLLDAMVKRYPNTKFIVEKEILENL